MRSVAFLRNFNLGQRGSASSLALTSAFEGAGASDMTLVRSNGTVLFTADSPQQCADLAVLALTESSEWNDCVFTKSVGWLAEVLLVTADITAVGVEYSFFDDTVTPTPLPMDGRRCQVVGGGPGWAVTVNERENESNASPTLEAALGVRVTSRALSTLHKVELLGNE